METGLLRLTLRFDPEALNQPTSPVVGTAFCIQSDAVLKSLPELFQSRSASTPVFGFFLLAAAAPRWEAWASAAAGARTIKSTADSSADVADSRAVYKTIRTEGSRLFFICSGENEARLEDLS